MQTVCTMCTTTEIFVLFTILCLICCPQFSSRKFLRYFDRQFIAAMKDKKKKEDRSAPGKLEFDAVLFEGKTLETCMLVLKCPEDPVIIKALSSIDNYANKAVENLQKLYTVGLLELLLPLVQHQDIYVKRFSTKIIAEMCSVDEAKNFLISSGEYVNLFMEMLQKETDVVVQEFCSLILAELSIMHTICATILDSEMPHVLLIRITSPDPDVQKNSLEIMNHIIKEPSSAARFTEIDTFSFKPLINLFRSDYPVIQNLAISVATLMTKDETDALVHELFRNEGGLLAAVEILEIFDWKDIHPNMLTLLSNCAASSETAFYLQNKGYLNRILLYMDKIHDENLVWRTLNVIAGIAKTDTGRKVLHENDIITKLLSLLQDESVAVVAAASLCISFMCKLRQAIDPIFEGNPIQPITALLRSDKQLWNFRHNAAHAIHELLWCDIKFCTSFVEQKKQDVVLSILQQPESEVPQEMFVTLIQILRALCVNDQTRTKLAGTDLIEILHRFLKGYNDELKIIACQTLSEYACESSVREKITDSGCLKAILKCLKAFSVPVKLAAANLVQKMVYNPVFVKAFIQEGGLQWMLDNRSVNHICPAWDTAIDAVFKNYLPAKFDYKGRLELDDITSDGFYVSRTKMKNFMILDELLSLRASPACPIYFANFEPPQSTANPLQPETPGEKKSSSRRGEPPAVKKPDKTEEQLACYGIYPLDPYLPHYLEKVKNLMSIVLIMKERDGNQILKERVKLLATFVAKQMSGSDPGVECTYHSHDLHITEIRHNLGSNIIPLGYVRSGYYLERAMLFKVLADRISLPCTLVRGDSGRAWVEIAMVEYTVSQDDANTICKVPSRICKPNCVVDLMNNIGQIWVLGSSEANSYCGKME